MMEAIMTHMPMGEKQRMNKSHQKFYHGLWLLNIN